MSAKDYNYERKDYMDYIRITRICIREVKRNPAGLRAKPFKQKQIEL
jgi:hypothetical protein